MEFGGFWSAQWVAKQYLQALAPEKPSQVSSQNARGSHQRTGKQSSAKWFWQMISHNSWVSSDNMAIFVSGRQRGFARGEGFGSFLLVQERASQLASSISAWRTEFAYFRRAPNREAVGCIIWMIMVMNPPTSNLGICIKEHHVRFPYCRL